MSAYRDRTGQRIGALEVLRDSGSRTKHGGVLWVLLDHESGRRRYLTTVTIIRLDRTRLAAEAASAPLSG